MTWATAGETCLPCGCFKGRGPTCSVMPDLALDLRYVRYALAAAELRSFRQTAEALDVSQSTVSRRIQILERRLGFDLFRRTHTGIEVTEAGRTFLAEISPGLAHIDRAARHAAATQLTERSSLRIGIVQGLLTPAAQAVLHRLRKLHPNIQVTIQDGTTLDHVHSVERGEIDLCLSWSGPRLAGHVVEKFWSEKIFVAVPRTHQLADCGSIPWSALRKETIIVAGHAESYRETLRFLANIAPEHELEQRIAIQGVSHDALIPLVAIDYGVALTCNGNAADRTDAVVLRPIADASGTLQISAIWLKRNSSTVLKKFLAVARSFSQAGRTTVFQTDCQRTNPK